ncbi:MAG: transposon-encoded TnpW family protein [Abditibacteriota bacterium]|nr:transposon-encoded TnpW family protein [Abditibacteriota bacterium]
MYRRIGNTTYKLRVHLSENARETMEDKILRMICAENLDKPRKRGIMRMPQMTQPLERSSL